MNDENIMSKASEVPISKSEFAQRSGVTPDLVMQSIADRKIEGRALSGAGREEKITESVATEQLRPGLDIRGHLGNEGKYPPNLDQAVLAATAAALPIATAENWQPDWWPLKSFASRYHHDVKTVIRFCQTYGIGHKPFGRWQVDHARYVAHVNGELYPPLPQAGASPT